MYPSNSATVEGNMQWGSIFALTGICGKVNPQW